MTVKKYILILISIACYVYITQWGVVLYGLLGGLATISNRFILTKYGKPLSFMSILLFVLGFGLVKSNSAILPTIGYSVFAFSGISFVTDQLRTRTRYSIIDIWLFLFFFPKMLAGPIVRIEDFISVNNWSRMSATRLYGGIKRLIYATFLKFIIADIVLDVEVNGVGIHLLLLSLIWGIRFYFDFYAYSLIAVGLGQILGINLPYNFNNPYGALSFKNFWQCWNITLTSWLKDYIYIPLGGNRISRMRTWLNTIITFAISGLWHGLSFPFILWGLAHGILVCIERTVISSLGRLQLMRKVYGLMVAFIITLLWQLFRLENIEMLQEYSIRLSRTTSLDPNLFVWLILAIALLCCIESKLVKKLMFTTEDSLGYVYSEVTLLAIMLVTLVLCPGSYTFNFFYFKF